MRTTSRALAVVTTALLFGPTGCGDAHNSAKTSTTTAAASSNPTATSAVPPTLRPVPPRPAPPEPGLADVECGPVQGSNGKSANVIAIATAAGRVGCTEAITVATDYIGTPRSGDAVAVDGWTCQPQLDPGTPHVCFKDDLFIGLRGGGGPATPSLSPSPAPTADVDCGTITDAEGATRTVIAVNTPAGQAGCTEAVNVASAYAARISDSDRAVVEGWDCRAQADPNVPSVCSRAGLLINLLAR
ncbi:hypothetical protein NDR87_24460 [Nocardia sp. CDC159]|uniref:Uncharacterized protein n=1 Tax=Nocardia pulmonis TaxID=2951408 RepID=A0A9X2E7K8_9NOCA|nr:MULTISPECIES: hypothetical protein [Nocardia]MCM6775055.1 hypothetical protein [Nocardia pulmonis]MCM6789525.1 hypothetical protein [Nocardia sp. CDC159]